jgi:hypothetical protein
VSENWANAQDGNHTHCRFPDDQTSALMAFYDGVLAREESDEYNYHDHPCRRVRHLRINRLGRTEDHLRAEARGVEELRQ